MHAFEKTQQMVADMVQYPTFSNLPRYLYKPDHPLAVLSAEGLRRALPHPQSLIFLAFSAGCLTAASVAHYFHHRSDSQVLGLLAIDGWGVPLAAPFPVHRLSHDHFTHITSTFSSSRCHFYADPAVPHLQIWQTPSQVRGWTMPAQQPTSAGAFIDARLNQYASLVL